MGEGWSAHRIYKWLKAEHSAEADFSYSVLTAFMRAIEAERAEVAQQVLRKQLQSSLTKDLERLEKHARKIDQKADQYADTEQGREYLQMVEQLRKLVDLKLHYSGADHESTASVRPAIHIPPESDD